MLEIISISGGSIGTNCYILKSEGNTAAVIDFVPEVAQYLNNNKIILKMLLLTHSHFDHIEELSYFQKENNFDLYMPQEAFNFFKNPRSGILNYFPPYVTDNIKNIDLSRVEIIYDNISLTFDDQVIDVMKTPGHSPDCVIYILKNRKIIFSGDTIFYGSIGRTDFPGGSYTDIEKSIKRIYASFPDDFRILPGHGAETSIGFEKINNPFVKA